MSSESVVAQHYNQLKHTGIEERKDSRIFHLRNFNNWIKSCLIGEFIEEVRRNNSRKPISVLDLGSGKGGDLRKWRIGKVQKAMFADIAGASVEQCKERYEEMKGHSGPPLFDAEFHAADCTKARLKDMYRDPNIEFDLTSCQFSFHYCFESLEQADRMVQNACENLSPGGFFVGTIPNANELVKRLRRSDSMEFGNSVYNVNFEGDKTDIPLFGAKYMFHLQGVVDCPEYLVYIPVLQKIAAKYDMKLLFVTPFADFFEEKSQIPHLRNLLQKMTALEAFPPPPGKDLTYSEPDAYVHAEEAVRDISDRSRDSQPTVGTLSKDEWEVATLYLTFAFQKRHSRKRHDDNGNRDSHYDRSESKRPRL